MPPAVERAMLKVKIGGFTSSYEARVILGQILSIAIYGSRTHTEVTSCD